MITSGGCERCRYVSDLNEALSDENERLRDHMESMIVLVQQFDSERTQLIAQNNAKIDSLELKIEALQSLKESEEKSLNRDQEETIKCLKDHIKSLERTNFNNELSVVSAIGANNRSNDAKTAKLPTLQQSMNSTSTVVKPLSPTLASQQKI